MTETWLVPIGNLNWECLNWEAIHPIEINVKKDPFQTKDPHLLQNIIMGFCCARQTDHSHYVNQMCVYYQPNAANIFTCILTYMDDSGCWHRPLYS